MTNKTIYAYTPPGADYPPFVNLSRNDGIRYTLTVRSQGNAGRDIASIVLFPDAVEAMANAALADLHGKHANAVTDEMVNRFLAWKLPADFNPDGGVSKRDGATPVGTNLLTAVQARAMLEHVLGVTTAADAHAAVGHHPDRDPSRVPEINNAPERTISLDDDTPLAPACDLSGDKTCEACQ